jgi:hypothetical protein
VQFKIILDSPSPLAIRLDTTQRAFSINDSSWPDSIYSIDLITISSFTKLEHIVLLSSKNSPNYVRARATVSGFNSFRIMAHTLITFEVQSLNLSHLSALFQTLDRSDMKSNLNKFRVSILYMATLFEAFLEYIAR